MQGLDVASVDAHILELVVTQVAFDQCLVRVFRFKVITESGAVVAGKVTASTHKLDTFINIYFINMGVEEMVFKDLQSLAQLVAMEAVVANTIARASLMFVVHMCFIQVFCLDRQATESA